MNNRIDYKKLTTESYNQIVPAFYRETQAMQLTKELKEFCSYLKHLSGKKQKRIRILNIGCGPGRDSLFFIKQGFKVVGVDASSQMIAFARKLVPQATFHKSYIEKMDFPNEYFDGIWATASLQHISKQDIPAVLKKIYKILRKGGVFFCDIRKGKKEGIESTYEYGAHLKRYMAYWSKKEFIKILKKTDFSRIRAHIVQELNRPFLKIRIFALKPQSISSTSREPTHMPRPGNL